MTEKTKVIWDEAERKALLEGAVVEEISRSRIVLRSKDGKRHVYAVCYQCGDANLVIESTESEAPPQRGV
jgi:hypothetical protein